ncbi:ribonucleotide reductase N-terminal alpha domain-containing protein, partial [Salmonella enterica]
MTENKVEYYLNPDNYKKENQMSHRIEKVIKRDGTVEDFAPEKLNGWAEYGCKTVDVSWSAITMAAQKTLPKGVVDSDTLMDALIKAAESLIKDNPAYDVPAKELRLAQMRKRLYDSFEPPSLRFFHDHMVSVGAWEDMSAWITDEQFEALNQVIDHDRDRLFTSGGLKQFFDKYSRRNIATGEIYETPQFAYMGMAMAMLSQPNWTILDAIDLYNAMSLHKINVPTPPLVGLRSSDRGFASCCLVDSTDTLDSIDTAEHIVFKMV